MTKLENALAEARRLQAEAEAKRDDLMSRLAGIEGDAAKADARRQEAGRKAVHDPAAVDAVKAAIADASIAATLADGVRFAITEVEAEIELRKADVEAAEAEVDRARLAELAGERIKAAEAIDEAYRTLMEAWDRYIETGRAIITSGIPLNEAARRIAGGDDAVFRAMPAAFRSRAHDEFRAYVGSPAYLAAEGEAGLWKTSAGRPAPRNPRPSEGARIYEPARGVTITTVSEGGR
ncbi:MAG: hypothetical protein ACM33T_06330 [Solirubrobacterales bacterium]